MTRYYEINEEAASHAHDMAHMDKYAAGSKTAAYREYVDQAYELADQVAEQRPGEADRAYRLADWYARRMADNMNAESRIGMMCPSVMICGPAKYPVKKHEKQQAAFERNMKDYQDVQGILEKIRAILNGKDVILSDDEKAIEKLEIKLATLKSEQEHMKAVNAYYRKNKSLDDCPDCTKTEIRDLKEEMSNQWHYEDKPFSSYLLTSNNQNIHRIEGRLKTLKEIKSRETTETENDYFRAVENTEAMRLQLFFNEKPDSDVRDILKGHGFKWSPKNGCWQRLLNENAKYAMNRVIRELDRREVN